MYEQVAFLSSNKKPARQDWFFYVLEMTRHLSVSIDKSVAQCYCFTYKSRLKVRNSDE